MDCPEKFKRQYNCLHFLWPQTRVTCPAWSVYKIGEEDVNCCDCAFALSFKWEESLSWGKDKDNMCVFGLTCCWLFCLVWILFQDFFPLIRTTNLKRYLLGSYLFILISSSSRSVSIFCFIDCGFVIVTQEKTCLFVEWIYFSYGYFSFSYKIGKCLHGLFQ